MPKRKKERGRPGRKYPPRVDATPEELARSIFKMPADHDWEYKKAEGGTVYRCVDCGEAVYYPNTLYRDGRCEACHMAV